MRGALLALVVALMSLNAVAAYGFLAKAHIGHQVEGDIAFASRLADIDRRPVLRRRILADCASDLVPWPEAGVAAPIRAHPELG